MLSAWNINAQAPPPTPVGPLNSDVSPPRMPSEVKKLAAGEFSVDSKVGWQQTSLSLQQGDKFKIKYVSGTWTVDFRSFTYVGPEGYTPQEDSQIFQFCKLDSSWVYGRLVGKVGNGAIFPIDRGGSFTANAGGELSLRIHDVDACLVDNDGSIVVEINGKEKVSPGSQFQFDDLPVKFSKISSVNWYGNTEFAYKYRDLYYRQLRGLHSGLDFIVPGGTPITSTVNRNGTVISVNNQPLPNDWGAGPSNVVVDYVDYIVLYGHTSPTDLPSLGAPIKPGDVIAHSGTDGNTYHLHLEVIKKYPSPAPGTKPGNIRTNPVLFFSQSDQNKMGTKAKRAGDGGIFHTPSPGNQWQTPEDQPDIDPVCCDQWLVP